MANVHIAVTRIVKQGCEADFDRELQKFARDSMEFDGMAGIHILRPPADTTSNEYGMLRSFESQTQADEFYQSNLFQQWTDKIADLVVGEPVRRKLTGLEAFFRQEEPFMPSLWKMAVVTYLGVFPTVLLWTSFLPQMLSGMHEFFVAAIVNALVVVTLTWAVMPMLTRLFDGWLHPKALPNNRQLTSSKE